MQHLRLTQAAWLIKYIRTIYARAFLSISE